MPSASRNEPGGRAGDHPHRRVGHLDLLLGGDPPQHTGQLLERRAMEVEPMAAVDDGGGNLVRLGGGQHEDHVRGRLLERLQERVPRRGREHVRLVEDVDAAPAAHGLERDVLAQLADVVDGVVGGGVHLDHVDGRAVGDGAAGRIVGREVGAGSALGVQRTGQELGHARLAGPPRADEQVGVMHLPELDRVAQCAHDVLLSHHLVEGARAVAAVEGEHGFRIVAVGRVKIEAASAATSGRDHRTKWRARVGAAIAVRPAAGRPAGSVPTHGRPHRQGYASAPGEGAARPSGARSPTPSWPH